MSSEHSEITSQIQKWVEIDNQMKSLSERMKHLKEIKSELEDNIHDFASATSLKTVKISDGELKFVQVKETQTLTFKYLETCLKNLFEDDKAKEILDYIKENREVKQSTELKRYYSKK